MNMTKLSEAAGIHWVQPAVGWNEWKDLSVPELGRWDPELSVAVIIPARDDQAGLDLTLASLTVQSYPAALLEVVVVDDGSAVPLTLPELRPARSKVIRLDPGPAFGAGRSRRAGAAAVNADVVLFADADIVLHRQHIEAHARWHHVIDYAVTMGSRQFVAFDDLSIPQVVDALRADAMDDLLAGRPSEGHDWIDRIYGRSDELTKRDEDPFRVAVGANVGVRLALYQASGGYAAFGRRGIEDTETGYRLQMAGGLFVPERRATSWHQGTRTMSRRGGEEIRRNRHWLLEHHLAVERYRVEQRGRQFAVPMVQVIVDVVGLGEEMAETVMATVDDLLASEHTDLHVHVVADTSWPDRRLLQDAYGPDARVTLCQRAPEIAPSPFELRIPAGYRLAVRSIGLVLAEIRKRQIGALRLVPPVSAEPSSMPTIWRTDARNRAALLGSEAADLEAAIGALYGEWWADSTEFGIADPEHHAADLARQKEKERASAALRAARRGAPDPGAEQRLRELEERLAERDAAIVRLRRRRALRFADALGSLRRRAIRSG